MVIARKRPNSKTRHALVSSRFLNQKELDPDFVDFNSVNRRYHYPARTYEPHRGAFLQIDPLLWRRRDTMTAYEFVGGNPAVYGDPAGELRCCVKSFTVQQSGKKVKYNEHDKKVISGKVFEIININAEFLDTTIGGGCEGETPDCACKCCEYRQWVKGYFARDGKEFTWMLAHDITMRKDVMAEDGRGNEKLPYGHRRLKEYETDVYSKPDRATGCLYKGLDEVTLGGAVNMVIDIQLEFQSFIIDVCSPKTLYGEFLTGGVWMMDTMKKWSVKHKHKIGE